MTTERPEAILLRELKAAHRPSPNRARWLATARPNQLPPDDDSWTVWIALAGRGFGKTRLGAEWAAEVGRSRPGTRIALVGPTFADARDVMIEGDSGLRSVMERNLVETWNRSMGEFVLTNGSRYKLFSAEEPERLRGPQFGYAWADELAAWKYLQQTWDQLQFGLRLGTHPQVCVTTTPKPRPLIRQLRDAPTSHVTVGSTFDNAANLAATALAQLRARYENTRLGRQELHAEVLEDTPGALWTRTMLEAAFSDAPAPVFSRVVVAVDPSGSSGATGDAQGIVVAGLGVDGKGYIIEDATMLGSPDAWAQRVAYLHDKHRADRVIAEANYGGAMVESVLRTAAPNLPVKLVHASRGKYVRAEPVAALYEQAKIVHLGGFPELEDEMTLMTGSGYVGPGSPNRVDALVWGLTELFLEDNAAGWLAFYQEELDRIAAGLPIREPEAPPSSPTHIYGEARVPNSPPPLKAPDAPKVRMIAPPNVTSFEIMPESIRYAVGPGRVVEVHPELVARMQAQGCRVAEPVE